MAAEDRLTAALSVLDEGVAVVDAVGRIEAVNDAFCRLVGRPAPELVDRSLLDPPWTLLDEGGGPVRPTDSPAVAALERRTTIRGDVCALARPDGSRAWVRMTGQPLPREGGELPDDDGALVVLRDLTEERRLRDHGERLATTDQLTGLLSRRAVTDLLDDAVHEARERPGARVGVIHVDLDGFRSVNDTFGPAAGDRVLAALADRLRDLGERRLSVGRLGGDEFLVVLAGDGASLPFDARLRRLAEEVQRRLHAPVHDDGLELRLTASVGVARTPGDADSAAGLLAASDRALSAGRVEGRHQLRFYESTLDERTRTGLALDRDLRRATAQRALEVHYQPIIDLRRGEIVGAEALVRWNHPERGPIPPSVFIPTAEATGAIGAISDLVMSTVATDIATWTELDLLPARTRISVNISPAEFERRDFVERVSTTLDAAGVTPERVELEITESLLVHDLREAASRLEQLHELGFLIALDDFGTGYSSLSYLHSLPFHSLKIDRRFVADLREGRSGTVTRAILALARNLGIVAVAEGVETEPQRHFLAEAGCDLVQGFLFAPPLPRAAFERFLAERPDPGAPAAPTG
jgi:diguanylate cyclase (GGDEF)-like protein/PAS domain S-box-containing protein